MIRAATFGFAGAATSALTPLVAKYLLHGNAGTYGLLLGATGVGAVTGALIVSDVRERIAPERAVRIAIVIVGLMVLVVGFSRSLPLTMAAMALGGAANMLTISMLNVAVQLDVPRWVAARSLAWFQSSLTGGLAIGAWFWGQVTAGHGVSTAMAGSGLGLLALPLMGLLLPLPGRTVADTDIVDIPDEPEVMLAVTHRSGPIVVELDYRVDPAQARSFYDAMLQLQGVRLRNGAFDWSLARDMADAALWTERYHFPTWQYYLRHPSRYTEADLQMQAAADAYDMAAERSVRRRLERPLGSVRWRADTPDPQGDRMIGMYAP